MSKRKALSLPERTGRGLLIGVLSSVFFLASYYGLIIFLPAGPLIAAVTIVAVCVAIRKINPYAPIAAVMLAGMLFWAGWKNEFTSPGGYALGVAWIIGVLIICGAANGKSTQIAVWVATIATATGFVLLANNKLPEIADNSEIAAANQEFAKRGMTIYTTSVPGYTWKSLEPHPPKYSQTLELQQGGPFRMLTVYFVPIPESCKNSTNGRCENGALTPDGKTVVFVDRPELLQVVMQNLKRTTYEDLYDRNKATNPSAR
jgi:hypothetical protein